jgi:hypothetical protein
MKRDPRRHEKLIETDLEPQIAVLLVAGNACAAA